MTQTEPRTSEGGVAAAPTWTRWRPILILLALIIPIAFLAFRIEIAFPATPSVNKTFTPMTQPAPQEVGSFDVLGNAINKDEATRLLQTDEGQKQLSPENGAVAVTEDLLTLGRKAFYSETFGNEVFQTDVVGALDGPINPVSMTKAIARLGGKPTTNLQIPLDEDVTIGGRTFKKGTRLNTGLDVPARSLANSEQLGMAGTLLQNIQPDPGASLRVLLDRNLRKEAIATNRANPNLQRSNVDGSGHNYWVDAEAGFTTQDQTDLIQFLLSLDDNPEVFPTSQR